MEEQRIFAEAALGFVRVDLVRKSEAEHLRVSVYPVDPISLDRFDPGQPAKRIDLNADGSIRSKSPAGKTRSQSPTP